MMVKLFLFRIWMNCSFILLTTTTIRAWSNWWAFLWNYIIFSFYFIMSHFFRFALLFWWTTWTWRWRRRRWWWFTKRHLYWLFLILFAHLIIIFFVELYCSLIKLRTLITYYKKFTYYFNFSRNCNANFLLYTLRNFHTLSKLICVITFCVTAIVVSILITACHQPPGTNTV